MSFFFFFNIEHETAFNLSLSGGGCLREARANTGSSKLREAHVSFLEPVVPHAAARSRRGLRLLGGAHHDLHCLGAFWDSRNRPHD